MRIKITRTNGDVVEAEGTPDECRAAPSAASPAPIYPHCPDRPPMPSYGPQPWDICQGPTWVVPTIFTSGGGRYA